MYYRQFRRLQQNRVKHKKLPNQIKLLWKQTEVFASASGGNNVTEKKHNFIKIVYLSCSTPYWCSLSPSATLLP